LRSTFEVAEFEAGVALQEDVGPYVCKCGIKVYEGVVPFELGFGYYCESATASILMEISGEDATSQCHQCKEDP
jgi:hypothetical protein